MGVKLGTLNVHSWQRLAVLVLDDTDLQMRDASLLLPGVRGGVKHSYIHLNEHCWPTGCLFIAAATSEELAKNSRTSELLPGG